MTLEEFVAKLRQDVDAFVPYIEQLNVKYPEAACHDLGEGDWFEQFVMFTDRDQ